MHNRFWKENNLMFYVIENSNFYFRLTFHFYSATPLHRYAYVNVVNESEHNCIVHIIPVLLHSID